ncbi:MAG: gamma-glutamyl-phosphate reductase, partial [Novosphingobium sp. 16-62-11]
MSTQPEISAQSVTGMVEGLARGARAAQRVLAGMDSPAKEHALKLAAASLRAAEVEILAANAQDMANGAANGLTGALLDRLKLTPDRLAGMADAVEQVASLADPVGEVISEAARPNGMVLQRLRIPVGVIGIIYESRPNVTADAATLCVRSGNATILRGGSEAVHSNRAIHKALVAGLVEGGVPADAVQLMPTQDRAAVGAML